MTQVRATLAAVHLGALHKKANVFLLGDILGVHRGVEAGPAGTGVKLGIGIEQLGAATNAFVYALILAGVISPGEGRLGAFLTRDFILFRRKDFFPFNVVFEDLVFHGIVSVL